MRLAYYGSDGFAVPALRALARTDHTIVRVFTNPDRPQGRSKTPQPTPVKQAAAELGLEIEQPEGRPGDDFAQHLQSLEIDLNVVVAYGQYLVRAVRKAPRLGYSINLHASLLPRWRGAAPDVAAIHAGDDVSGVTVQRVGAAMDAGAVILTREEAIRPDDTRGTLRERLAEVGAEALVDAVDRIAADTATFTKQDESQVTLAPFLSKQDGRLDLTREAAALERQVRAFLPWPVAYLELEKGRVQVVRALVRDGAGTPGEVLEAKERLVVATGAGALELMEVKPSGKRVMEGVEFARGRRLQVGEELR